MANVKEMVLLSLFNGFNFSMLCYNKKIKYISIWFINESREP